MHLVKNDKQHKKTSSGEVLTLIENTEMIKNQNIRFSYEPLTIIEYGGTLRYFMFIVLRNETIKTMKVTGYSTYFFSTLQSTKLQTLEFHAKIIVRFLNYLFFDNHNKFKMNDITDLQIEHGNKFIRDYAQGNIGKKFKTEESVQKVERVLTRFYKFIYDQLKEKMKYITYHNFYIKTVKKKNAYRKDKSKEIVESLFSYSSPSYIPPQKIKHMPSYVFQTMLEICDIHYPHIKLALCLQAFGGLRAGEVCNVSRFNTSLQMHSKDLAWFSVDLREKVQMRTDGKDVGGIKKARIQPIHPVFLGLFEQLWNQHMQLIKGIDNPFGAIFMNRENEAMTVGTYEDYYFNEIRKLTLEKISKKGDFRSVSEANILMSGSFNTHILRHFFTQFLAELESTKSPIEVAYWRGDSSLDSAITYYSQHPVIDEKIKHIQRSVFKELRFGGE
ncbi:hypothetical protein [Paenibacillus sp. 22594]|uniref:hypothetical protein n=1 Tax=Paenibacillus sp. 22594 TaxID=3453947 RepID=UPI003F84586B